MTHLSDEVRHGRFRKLVNLYVLRDKGAFSEDQIAHKLGFFDPKGTPSTRGMYERLQEDWRLPDWAVYPDGVGKRTQQSKQHRVLNAEVTRLHRTQNSIDAIEELPPAEDAMDLFDKATKALSTCNTT